MAKFNLRGMLYKGARMMGDFQALKTGKIGQRMIRKSIGKMSGNLQNKV